MSICKQCGSSVNWVRRSGRTLCLNPDGSDHWDLCSKRRFERIKRAGEHFKTEDAEGYKTPLKKSGVLYMHIRAESKHQSKGRSGECMECTPPWEEPCANCPDRPLP